MKKVLLLLLLLVAVGGYWYYRSFAQGPKYALVQAAKAVQTHDTAEFERYVDVSSVTGNLVDQLTMHSSALGFLNPGGLAMGGALRLLKPQLANVARQEVRRYVETGSLEAAAETPSKGPVNISVAGVASKVVSPQSKFKDVEYVREEGNEARVGLSFTQPKYDTTMVVELKMQKENDNWRVKEITNVGSLVQHVARLEKKKRLGR